MRTKNITAAMIPDKTRALFWQHMTVPRRGCWIWVGAKFQKGYGNFHIRGIGNIGAHIVAFLLTHEDVVLEPKDCVLHKCDNPPCCRPVHLFKGSKKENTHDMIRKGRAKFVGFRFVRNRLKGEDHPKSKLTVVDVIKIRRARLSGVSQNKLAAQFGVRKQSIQAIEYGRSWKHVPEAAE